MTESVERRASRFRILLIIPIIVLTAIIAWAFYPTLLSLIFKQSSTTGSVCDWFMEKHLSAITSFSTEIRDHAISILKNFSNPDILLENTTYYIPGGRALQLSFYATSGAIIKANITANSNVLIEIYGPEGSLLYSQLTNTSSYSFTAYATGTYVLRITNKLLRTGVQVSILLEAIVPVDINDPVFKIMAIGHWVGANVKYVSDPRGLEYVASPLETLRVGAGDCDDFAVLIASLYESIGLDAVIGLVDTNGDGVVDHAAALVYVDLDPDVLLKAMQRYDLVFNTRTSKISYYSNVKNVQTGVWLIIDPPMADVKDAPWSISHEPYVLECYVDAYLKK
jgi:hypothetical protein